MININGFYSFYKFYFVITGYRHIKIAPERPQAVLCLISIIYHINYNRRDAVFAIWGDAEYACCGGERSDSSDDHSSDDDDEAEAEAAVAGA